MDELSIPFFYDDISWGLQEMHGILEVQKDALVIEYQVQDALLGTFKSETELLTIPFTALRNIELKKSLFSTSITIEAKRIRTFEDFPGSKAGAVKVKIKKKERERAEHFISSIKLRLSELKIEQLDLEHERMLNDGK